MTSFVGPITAYDPRSAVGPASNFRQQGFTDGYNPPSRNGERTVNAFVCANEFNNIVKGSGNMWRFPSDLSKLDNTQKLKAMAAKAFGGRQESYEQMINEDVPPFNEWASVQVGTVAVMARSRTVTYKNAIGAQTSIPVITCAQKLGTFDNHLFRFAGVTRTDSKRPYDDGRGPTMDEYFTLTIGGIVQMANNGNGQINQGDLLEWTFFDDSEDAPIQLPKRRKMGPRTIVIRPAKASNARVFGRALSDAMPGDLLDVYITSAS